VGLLGLMAARRLAGRASRTDHAMA
jgi:hypothetical protein